MGRGARRCSGPCMHAEARVHIEQDPRMVYLPSHCFSSSGRSGSKKASVMLSFPFMVPNFRLPRGL